MSGLDIVFLAILLISLLVGLWRGLVHEVLSLLGWPIAFIASKMWAGDIAPSMPTQEPLLRMILAYVLVFVVVLILWAILVWLVSKLVKAAGLGWLDRFLGGLFGVLRGVLILLLGVWLAGLTSIPQSDYWQHARLTKAAENVAILTKSWLPDGLAKRIHY